MRAAPKSLRLHIGLFGRRNAGKSSLLNALTRQQVSIVSEVAGTTTDPVEKPMELLPLGPGAVHRHGGIDDVGALGEMRVQKTRQVFDRTDVGIVVVDAGQWGEFEEAILGELRGREDPGDRRLQQVGPRPSRRRRCSTGLREGQDAVGRDGGHRRPRACSTCARP